MHYLQHMQGEELRSFKAGFEYQAWKVSEEAQILLLWGYNNNSILQEVECWLSPIATSTIHELSQNGCYLAYDIVIDGKRAHEVLSLILLQLLRFKSDTLNDENQYSELSGDLETYRLFGGEGKHSNENSEAELNVLQNIAARIIGFFEPSEIVYIVIDRVDRCSRNPPNHRKALLDALVKMVEAADCKLKVLTVINGYDWDSRYYDLENRRGKRCVMEQALKF
ncbi:uncharacterized protein EAE98_002616 [Botrytis deweyae]|uniref:Orc1-like AAA ATPase domain-containing protein n=1 Tax=Botrytis deweyae TaxID=2478750 RepID=A0ABQ7IXN4_9HELO|nr:uncharacterized protein EAE98_002616 [Botrytis deweyae]KAF7936397.1 hypothetical protein EAE98_002616 [Botrytis deweyae]